MADDDRISSSEELAQALVKEIGCRRFELGAFAGAFARSIGHISGNMTCLELYEWLVEIEADH